MGTGEGSPTPAGASQGAPAQEAGGRGHMPGYSREPAAVMAAPLHATRSRAAPHAAPETRALASSARSRNPGSSSPPGPGASTGPEPAGQRGLAAEARAAHVAAHSGPCLPACPAPPGPRRTLAAAMGARRRRLYWLRRRWLGGLRATGRGSSSFASGAGVSRPSALPSAPRPEP